MILSYNIHFRLLNIHYMYFQEIDKNIAYIKYILVQYCVNNFFINNISNKTPIHVHIALIQEIDFFFVRLSSVCLSARPSSKSHSYIWISSMFIYVIQVYYRKFFFFQVCRIYILFTGGGVVSQNNYFTLLAMGKKVV